MTNSFYSKQTKAKSNASNAIVNDKDKTNESAKTSNDEGKKSKSSKYLSEIEELYILGKHYKKPIGIKTKQKLTNFSQSNNTYI